METAVTLAFVLALWRGVVLPPIRVALVVGFVLMALSHVRNAEVLALLGPMVIAAPLARWVGGPDANTQPAGSPRQGLLLAGLAIVLAASTLAVASVHRFEPNVPPSPVAAVAALKEMNVQRVVDD